MERLRGTCISIHASAREATRGATFQADHKIISIHASAREATEVENMTRFDINHFNPRLREGGDLDKWHVPLILEISIHASAREATALITNFYI